MQGGKRGHPPPGRRPRENTDWKDAAAAKEGRGSGPGAEPGRLWGGAACSVGLCWLPRMLAQRLAS